VSEPPGTPPPRPGARAGARRGARRKRTFDPTALGLCLAALASVAAWCFLVWAAISFGSAARGGDASRWVFLGVASIGAVACLFLGLLLVTMVLRRVGILEESRPRRH
jgi:hypothetical protein